MNDKKELQVVNGVAPSNGYERLKKAVVVGTTTAMASTMASAAELDAIGASLTGEITGAKAVLITLLTAAAIIIAIIVGWKFLKRGANAA